MNKSQLVEHVAKEIDTSRSRAEGLVHSVLEGIAKGLKKDRSVSLVGFGTFSVKNRKARMGRNPKTGEPIQIRASRTVGFRAGRQLKEGV
jgi:DNA-binding protein HU-beta